MREELTERRLIKVVALDDPLGWLETTEGAIAVRQAVGRLRRAGYAQVNRLLTDPNVEQNRPVRMFQRYWKGVTWVVLASWDGSLAYRVPAEHFDAEDPFKVPFANDLPEDTPAAAREHLRRVRWVKVGVFLDVVEAILELPEPAGQAPEPRQDRDVHQ